MTNFASLGVTDPFVTLLNQMNIMIPTPIQQETIPVVLTDQDVFAIAQTGSGKTIAYLLPLLIKLLNNRQHCGLILTPTRELATQVFNLIHQLGGKSPRFTGALLIGGAPMSRQIASLKNRPRLIVGTPGRINDHLLRRSLILNEAHYLVVDEADRMLDMGFEVQLEQIVEHLPSARQTLMFSATLPANIEKLLKKHLHNPKRICIASSIQAAPKIKQEVLRLKHSEKFTQLLQQIDQRKGSILIFTRTRRGASQLSNDLQDQGHSSNAIHGDLAQRCRDRVIQSFRNSSIRILVATDIAARGIDIPHIMHVINYDLPQCPEDYIHRIGRTARAGAEGHALSFITSADNQKWKAICNILPSSTPGSDGSQSNFTKNHSSDTSRPKRHFSKNARWKHKKRNRSND